jgi:Fe-S-cluster containining protein
VNATAELAPATPRFLTLTEARALECNGCGDCCDSRRTDGFWAWGALPADQYSANCGGQPLIIPLERAGGSWRDRAYRAEDAGELSGSRFRCSAFEPHDDGDGACGRHNQTRPAVCGDFPVWGAAIEDELAAAGTVPVQADAFPRCTWHGLAVVREGDPRLG